MKWLAELTLPIRIYLANGGHHLLILEGQAWVTRFEPFEVVLTLLFENCCPLAGDSFCVNAVKFKFEFRNFLSPLFGVVTGRISSFLLQNTANADAAGRRVELLLLFNPPLKDAGSH
jgi:hypothetical protein